MLGAVDYKDDKDMVLCSQRSCNRTDTYSNNCNTRFKDEDTD